MLFALFFFTFAQAAPKPDTYYLGTDADLTISESSEQEIHFELNGVNSYNGHTSALAGLAVKKGTFWEYRDKEDKSCVLQLKPAGPSSIEVALKDCHQDWLSQGIYKVRSKDCGIGFDKRNKEIASLSRAKKFLEALKRADSLAKDCAETLDENARAELHSDLAFLAFKAGDKERCRAEVKKGIQAIGAFRGLKELREAFESYAEEGEDGKKSCKMATNPGCWKYEERIKVFKRLDHNRKLCAK